MTKIDQTTIRLSLVNSPERGEPGYQEAKDYQLFAQLGLMPNLSRTRGSKVTNMEDHLVWFIAMICF